jgi:hypothetical protein
MRSGRSIILLRLTLWPSGWWLLSLVERPRLSEDRRVYQIGGRSNVRASRHTDAGGRAELRHPSFPEGRTEEFRKNGIQQRIEEHAGLIDEGIGLGRRQDAGQPEAEHKDEEAADPAEVVASHPR